MMEGKRDGAQSDQADAATANNPEKANPNNRRKPNVPPKVLCSKGCGKEYLVSRRSLAHRLTHEDHCLGPLSAPKKAATATKAAAKPADSFSDNKRKAPTPKAPAAGPRGVAGKSGSRGKLARGRGVKAAHAAETVSTCTSGSGESSDSDADRYGQLEKKVKAEGKKRKRVEDLQQETATKVLMLEEQVKGKAGLVASPDGSTQQLHQHLQAFERAQQPVFAVLRQVVSSVLASPVASATSSVSSVAAHGTELPPSEEFAKICQSYQHVQWHQMTWIDFCSQSSAELSEMLGDPEAKVNRAHKMALNRLHGVGPTTR
jgi:hypothetical protein